MLVFISLIFQSTNLVSITSIMLGFTEMFEVKSINIWLGSSIGILNLTSVSEGCLLSLAVVRYKQRRLRENVSFVPYFYFDKKMMFSQNKAITRGGKRVKVQWCLRDTENSEDSFRLFSPSSLFLSPLCFEYTKARTCMEDWICKGASQVIWNFYPWTKGAGG